MMIFIRGVAVALLPLFLSFFFSGCFDKNSSSEPDDPDTALLKRGRAIYMANCTACHHRDPAKNGALGPSVAGSSQELLEARILRAEYPPGYQPKRPSSRAMAALPHLSREIPALVRYLNQ